MRALLAAAIGAAPLMASSAAHAQARLADPVAPTNTHAPSFTLPATRDFSPRSPLDDGMIARKDLAPNARMGVGLAPMLGRNIRSLRIERELVRRNNPGVTLVIKFPH